MFGLYTYLISCMTAMRKLLTQIAKMNTVKGILPPFTLLADPTFRGLRQDQALLTALYQCHVH